MKKTLTLIILINILLSINLFAAKNLYVSYKEIPKQVYKNQKFEVTIKALVTTKNFDYITTSFSNSKNIKVLNPNSKWVNTSGANYENKFFFKADKGSFRLPTFSNKLVKNGNVIEVSTLSSKNIAYSDIAKGDERFSNIIAKDFKLKAYKTKQYNNKESLTIIDIDALNSNLEDFSLFDIKEQGTSKLIDNYPNQNLIYYVVMPIHKKKLQFKYYNTTSKSFVTVTVPLILQNELVSTQTDLNPNDSSFEKYKKMAVVLLLLLFVLLFIWKRNKIYLAISIILLIVSVIYLMPNRTGIVKKDSYIYILPTKNSTIFFKLDNKEKVEILNRKKDFIKVMGIDKKFIGWIKEENFGKN
ncbi:hypothetical protein [Poseidonibacter ostreae]|mgnify:CR=1 FL=1|jgi:hypothetical protein|uniref:Periplasmic protein n=1 Tax=Poseidonibacter ostreae TaxID=2654171 RepID=A0A6L4WT80_9BACT|nr:hypothetical protein [Poseidonibacter ostreae]KAB7886005.1 hypothetical protein GA417_06545 [Poseidonibacter ostreae]KAB7889457.1 hypothetical protein GBG19_05980 [Poseidonibacter ostreae]KAB7892530.1 hypothetical protein GBG18_02580 [Poseidonibacter ostreae]MAC84221.1 hypothetical protein [Arcobacter sp.]|tara:strand:+ start:90 stop:1160 length:1071 start_codon:yes stop_codon:yes gene_type:complete